GVAPLRRRRARARAAVPGACAVAWILRGADARAQRAVRRAPRPAGLPIAPRRRASRPRPRAGRVPSSRRRASPRTVALSFRRRTLTNPADAAELLGRLARLHHDRPRGWGRMSAPQMVSHLRDAFLMGTAQKPVRQQSGPYRRTIVKWIALYAPFTWPAG